MTEPGSYGRDVNRLCLIGSESVQRRQPSDDGPPDLVRRIFLNEMYPRDRHLGLRWPRADGVEIRAAAEERTRLGLYKQLGHITRRDRKSVV